MEVDVIKSRSTSVLVSRNRDNEIEYKALLPEDHPGIVCLNIEGMFNGKEIWHNMDLSLADIPYLVDLLKEYC